MIGRIEYDWMESSVDYLNFDQRREMLQTWAVYLDELRNGIVAMESSRKALA